MVVNKREHALILTALRLLEQVYDQCAGDLPDDLQALLDAAPGSEDETVGSEVGPLFDRLQEQGPDSLTVVVAQDDSGISVTAHRTHAGVKNALHAIIDDYRSGHSMVTAEEESGLRAAADRLEGFSPVGSDTVDVFAVEIEE